MHTALAFLGALAAAGCYGSSSVLQAVAVRRVAPRSGVGAGMLVDLARQAPYVAGLLLDGVGFLASLLAFRRLPLFVVQATISSSVGVTALLAARLMGAHLRRVDRVALWGVGLGLLLLAASSRPEAARRLALPDRWLVLAGTVVVALLGLVTERGPTPTRAAGLAALAGAAFGGVGVAARALEVPNPWWQVLSDPLVYAVGGYGLLGVLLFATALRRGSVTTASAVMFTVSTVVPAGVGVALLGDGARAGFVPVAAAGVVVTIASAVALARYGGQES